MAALEPLGHRLQRAERDAKALVKGAEVPQRAMQVDGPVVARLAQQGDDPLRLAQRIGTDDMRALRKEGEALQQPGDLVRGVGMAEDRQREGGLGDEDVAGHRLEAHAGRVVAALVVAGDDDAAALPFQHDLRRAQHMTGRDQGDTHAAMGQGFAIAQRLLLASRIPLAEAGFHDRQGFRRGKHGTMAGARMVGMAVADHRAGDGA